MRNYNKKVKNIQIQQDLFMVYPALLFFIGGCAVRQASNIINDVGDVRPNIINSQQVNNHNDVNSVSLSLLLAKPIIKNRITDSDVTTHINKVYDEEKEKIINNQTNRTNLPLRDFLSKVTESISSNLYTPYQVADSQLGSIKNELYSLLMKPTNMKHILSSFITDHAIKMCVDEKFHEVINTEKPDGNISMSGLFDDIVDCIFGKIDCIDLALYTEQEQRELKKLLHASLYSTNIIEHIVVSYLKSIPKSIAFWLGINISNVVEIDISDIARKDLFRKLILEPCFESKEGTQLLYNLLIADRNLGAKNLTEQDFVFIQKTLNLGQIEYRSLRRSKLSFKTL